MPTLKNGKWKMPKDRSVREWKNTSHYPDAWAMAAVEWLCEFYKVNSVAVTITDAPNRRGSGRAFLESRRVHLSISRANYREDWKYWNLHWDKPRFVRSDTEAFIFLAAHEIAHISPEGRDVWNRCERAKHLPNMGAWRKRMEFAIQDMAQRALDAYRDEAWKCILRVYAGERRGARAKRKRADQSRSVEARLARMRSRLDAWKSKRLRAERAIAKLRRSVAAIERSSARGR